jgi:protein gp37
MGQTIISWATHTTNVVHGCSKPAAVPPEHHELAQSVAGVEIGRQWTKSGTSPECIRCYAENLSNRRGWTPEPWLEKNEAGNIILRPERFRDFRVVPVVDPKLPPSFRKRFFICSMGDIFHRRVPDSHLRALWTEMLKHEHVYMLLTKRPDRAAEWPGPWPENIWLGATCGHPVTKWRIEFLRRSQAKVRFVSMEPLLAPMAPLNLAGIHQVIVGGESGSGYRPMKMEWARDVRDECVRQGSAFFFKQDAAFRTESRCYLVEQDGSCWQWRQFPGELTPPKQVDPDSPKKHAELFPVI